MHHLTLEDLARLVDEAPQADESGHLRNCLVCRRELDAMRDQTDGLAALDLLEPSPTAWAALESRLLQEGLLRTAAPPVTVHTWRPALRIAASIALFLAGGLAGALLWQRTGAPAGDPIAALPPAEVAEPAPAPPGYAAEVETGPLAPPQGAVLAANPGPAPRTRPAPQRPRSPAVRQAEQELAEAESAYLAALARYGELADPASGADPLTRLDALERLVEMSGRALERAPDDPQLNGYHIAAVNERDALRRQVQRAAQTNWF